MNTKVRIGLIGALDEEIALIRATLTDCVTKKIFGIDVVTGRLSGRRVALAKSGVGKVNAALAGAALASCGVSGILFTGLAGGIAPEIEIGDVVVANELGYHDVDVTKLGMPPGQLLGEQLFWAADDQLQKYAISAANAIGLSVYSGRIISGDQFIATGALRQQLANSFDALAVEMEGAALAQVAAKLGLPFVVIRIISDTANHEAAINFSNFLDDTSRTILKLIRAVLAQIPDSFWLGELR